MSCMCDSQDKIYDVAVIGSGPAGMTAALYAARAGLSVLIFEQLGPGGQLAETEIIENYPGFPEGIGGFDLAWNMREQAARFGVEEMLDEVVGLCVEGDIKHVHTSTECFKTRSVVVATGARPRKLGLPNDEALQGKGISYCATCDGNFFKNKVACIVGGGDTAAADALYLSRICSKVIIIYRRNKLRATAVYHKMLEGIENLSFEWNSVVLEAHETNGLLSAVTVEDVNTKEQKVIETNALFVAIGLVPNTEFLQGSLELDEAGYIISDELGRTNVRGVFAAGDVRTKALRQVTTAVGDGANVAERVAEYLAEKA